MHVICISICKKLRSHPQPGPSRAMISRPPWDPTQWVLFYLFPRVGVSQAREFQIAMTTMLQKTAPKHNFLQCFQFPYFSKAFKTPLFTLFSSNFSMFQCRWPTYKSFNKHLFFTMFLKCFLSKTPSNLHVFRHKVEPQRTLFFAVFSMLWHPKTFQNIAI